MALEKLGTAYFLGAQIPRKTNIQLAEKIDETIDYINETVRPYKSYAALMTQTGTSAPTVTVLENTIGDIVWSYSGTGAYNGTLTGAFPANKVIAFISNNDPSANAFSLIERLNSNTMVITTSDDTATNANGILSNTSVLIRVYN